MIKQFLPIITLLALLISCQDKSSETETEQKTDSTNLVEQYALPVPPIETLEYLYQNCSHIDYVFYELPFSMSLDDVGSIRKTLSHISTSPAPEKAECKPMGRIFFDVGIETKLEADFYFSSGCVYFLFYEGGEKKYSSFMTPDAVKYMNNYISQANAQRQQIMQNQ